MTRPFRFNITFDLVDGIADIKSYVKGERTHSNRVVLTQKNINVLVRQTYELIAHQLGVNTTHQIKATPTLADAAHAVLGDEAEILDSLLHPAVNEAELGEEIPANGADKFPTPTPDPTEDRGFMSKVRDAFKGD